MRTVGVIERYISGKRVCLKDAMSVHLDFAQTMTHLLPIGITQNIFKSIYCSDIFWSLLIPGFDA